MDSAARSDRPTVNTLTLILPVVILSAILMARWMFVTGFGDFGMDYDMASRLLDGQRQGRDFFAVIPALTGYTLSLLMKEFGCWYLLVNINLWSWWALNVAAAAATARVWTRSAEAAALAALVTALLCVPPNTHGSSFAFIASTFSASAVALYGIYRRRASRDLLHGLLAVLAGLVCGVAACAKPNVGLGTAIALVMVSAWEDRARAGRLSITAPLAIGSGTVIGFLVIVSLPAFSLSTELLGQMFNGASDIKGGPWMLVARALPRISLGLNGTARVVAETAVTAVVLGAVLAWAWRRRPGAEPAGGEREEATCKNVSHVCWAFVGLVALLSAVSAAPMAFPHQLTAFAARVGLVSPPFFLWQVLYVAFFATLIAGLPGVLRGSGRRADRHIAAAVALIVLLFQGMSGRYNSVFAAAVAVPALLTIIPLRDLLKPAAVFVALWTLTWHVAPYWRSTFGTLTALPARSAFAGLYWPDGATGVPGGYPVWSSSETIVELDDIVTPLARDRSILWLVAGPGMAFGGRPYRYGIHGLSPNNVTYAASEQMGRSLRTAPADVVVATDLADWSHAAWPFMQPAMVRAWLARNYSLVWRSPGPFPLFVWERKR